MESLDKKEALEAKNSLKKKIFKLNLLPLLVEALHFMEVSGEEQNSTWKDLALIRMILTIIWCLWEIIDALSYLRQLQN